VYLAFGWVTNIKEKIMLGALIGPIASLASSWMDSKVEKVKAELKQL
jgi:hypothetical protein